MRVDAHTPDDERRWTDRGETMLMTTVLISFLLLASWALISGSQQWGARRDVQAAASAASRAGAQVSEAEVRGGVVVIDRSLAGQRADAVLDASGYTGSTNVVGTDVIVVATASVTYAFPSPGFPTSLTATGTSSAISGISSNGG